MIGSPIKYFTKKVERTFRVLYNEYSDRIIIMPSEHELIQGETFDIPFDEMIEIIDEIKKTWKNI